jgi:hypothetical protein
MNTLVATCCSQNKAKVEEIVMHLDCFVLVGVYRNAIKSHAKTTIRKEIQEST